MAQRETSNKENGIPHGLEMLRETGSIEAFQIASGKSDSELRGFVYRDSDVYKWMEAASYEGLDIDWLIQEIADAQDEDGYINTSFSRENKPKRFSNLQNDHEIYCAGHLIQAAVAHHHFSKKSNFLEVALKLAAHLDDKFGEQGALRTCGHPVIEMALTELYRETRYKRWLALANRMLHARGCGVLGGREYLQDHLPFLEQTKAVGHAVRALYLYAGAADIYLETGDERLIPTLNALWEDVYLTKMYITGGIGARHEGEAFGEPYELPNLRAYAETCAAIASMQWNWRMFAMSGEPKYVDEIERALYNGFLSGMSIDLKSYFYVNPLASSGAHMRHPWYSCACCPPNIYRTLASMRGMVLSEDDSSVYVNLYASCEAQTRFGKIEINTEYPFDGNVEILTEKPCSLKLRIPKWCSAAKANGIAAGKGYCKVRSGGKVDLQLEMPCEKEYSDFRVENNRGSAAIRRGPLIYCVEEQDVGEVELLGIAKGSGLRLARHELGIPAIEFDSVAFGSEVRKTAPAIPYFAWANRGAGAMKVWLPEL